MPAGRPLIFKSVEELDEAILGYFEKCEKTNKPLTLAGLANALDVDRKTLLNYSHNEEFFPSIKKAKSLCEQYAEEMLFQGRNVAGVIFNLKNNYEDWKDKQEVDQNIKGSISLTDLFNKAKENG
jgi:DNA-binding XRE family transcriptional regulator